MRSLSWLLGIRGKLLNSVRRMPDVSASCCISSVVICVGSGCRRSVVAIVCVGVGIVVGGVIELLVDTVRVWDDDWLWGLCSADVIIVFFVCIVVLGTSSARNGGEVSCIW